MSGHVFLVKNIDLDAEIKAIMESTYSASLYHSSLAKKISILSELAEARLRLKDLEEAPSLESNQEQIEYELELGGAIEIMLLDNVVEL